MTGGSAGSGPGPAPAATQAGSRWRRAEGRLRLRTAFIVWGLLAIVGWFAMLLPAYVLIDQGPRIVQAFFDAPAADGITAEQAEALGSIAPAAGGAGD